MLTKTKMMSAMSYLGVLCFVPLLLGGGNHFISFHARQGLVIWLWSMTALILFFLPLGQPIFMVSSIAIMILSAIGLVSVTVGQTWRLPLVYDLAEKFWPSMAATSLVIRGFDGTVQRGRHA